MNVCKSSSWHLVFELHLVLKWHTNVHGYTDNKRPQWTVIVCMKFHWQLCEWGRKGYKYFLLSPWLWMEETDIKSSKSLSIHHWIFNQAWKVRKLGKERALCSGGKGLFFKFIKVGSNIFDFQNFQNFHVEHACSFRWSLAACDSRYFLK